MRTIKFRAWDKVNKLMLSWEILKALSTNDVAEGLMKETNVRVYDRYIEIYNLSTQQSHIEPIGGHFEKVEEYVSVVRYKRGHNIWDDDNLEKLEFTEIVDKNDKDIYQGDIVKWVGINGNVDGMKMEVKIPNCYDSEADDNIYYGTNWEVVGNIYENPELIQKP